MGNPKLQCICQICSCGRHYCIHRPQPRPKPTGPCVMTEYKDTFRSFSSHEPTRPIVPETNQRPSEKKFDGNTTYKDIFIQHDTKPITKRNVPTYQRPDGIFNGTSSYQHDFFPKQAQKTQSAKPEYNKAVFDKPFDGLTVNQETYKVWDLPSHEFKAPKPAISLPKGSFNHKTTFQTDYHGHNGITGRETINPPGPSLSVGSGKIANQTTTKSDYGRKYTRPVKSAKPQYSKIQHEIPFDNNTTAKNAFKWPAGRPASSCKPEECTKVSREALETRTTHNLTYKQWNNVARTQTIRPGGGWTAPSDTFDHKTTVQHDYDAKSGAPAKSARPDYKRPKPGDFDSMTTHMDAFKVWQAKPRESFRPIGGYKGPTANFDSKTTFQTDFVGHKNSDTRPDLCIPKEGGVSFSGNQEFNTMYKTTFLGTMPPRCPATKLQGEPGTASGGFSYEADKNGHQFYAGPPQCKSTKSTKGDLTRVIEAN